MSDTAQGNGKLTTEDFLMIDFVVRFVQDHDSIPASGVIAEYLHISRQACIMRMNSMTKRGILHARPRYATNWFILTEEGESLYKRQKRLFHAM